jgi:hypothetical protein
VVELVDTRDLKSLARKGVPVRLRPEAPQKNKGFRLFGWKPFWVYIDGYLAKLEFSHKTKARMRILPQAYIRYVED